MSRLLKTLNYKANSLCKSDIKAGYDIKFFLTKGLKLLKIEKQKK